MHETISAVKACGDGQGENGNRGDRKPGYWISSPSSGKGPQPIEEADQSGVTIRPTVEDNSFSNWSSGFFSL